MGEEEGEKRGERVGKLWRWRRNKKEYNTEKMTSKRQEMIQKEEGKKE